MVELEEQLERNNEFWETDNPLEGEEREGKMQLRRDSKKLRQLRQELDGLWYERIRLGAEGTFSRTSIIVITKYRLTSIVHVDAVVDAVELKFGSQIIRSYSGMLSAFIHVRTIGVQTWSQMN